MVVINVPGYVQEQPEVKYVGETPVIKVKVVDKQRRKNRATGEWESVYLDFVFECWDKDALYHAEKLTKGRNVIAVGTNPKKEEWIGNKGENRECLVYELVSVGYPYQERQTRSDGEGQAPQGRPAPTQQPATNQRYAQRAVAGTQIDAEPKPRGPSGPAGQQQQQQQQQPQRHEPRVNAETGAAASRFDRRNNRVNY